MEARRSRAQLDHPAPVAPYLCHLLRSWVVGSGAWSEGRRPAGSRTRAAGAQRGNADSLASSAQPSEQAPQGPGSPPPASPAAPVRPRPSVRGAAACVQRLSDLIAQ